MECVVCLSLWYVLFFYFRGEVSYIWSGLVENVKRMGVLEGNECEYILVVKR